MILAAAILSVHPQGLLLVVVIAVLQFIVEIYVVRNYALAVVFITPLALTISAGGRAVPDLGQLLLARGADTLIGCVVALVVYRLTERRRPDAGVVNAIAATLDAVAATARGLAAGAVTTSAARAARRDLQIRAIALVSAYHAGIGGSPRQRVAAERMWPVVVITERLAYRTLAACWAVESIGSDNARDVGRTLLDPHGLRQLTAALSGLAAAVRTGRPPAPVTELPAFGAAEVTALQESLGVSADPPPIEAGGHG
ncbi:FUSC family protein [Mycolicibacterium thermoresistibile]